MKHIDRIVAELLAEVREDNGAKSLSHLTVTVPTAQSGRRLRLALARAAGGAIVPPEIRLPDQALVDPDDPRLATRSEELLAMAAALRDGRTAKEPDERSELRLAAQLLELRHLLFEKALSFADVAEFLEKDPERFPLEEAERWRDLAGRERLFYAELAKRDKTDRVGLASSRVEVGSGRVEVGSSRVDVGSGRVEVGSSRVEVGSSRVEIGSSRVEVGSSRVEVGSSRDEVGSGRVDVGSGRVEINLVTPNDLLRPNSTLKDPKRPYQTLYQLKSPAIIPCATAASEAEVIAEYFAAVRPDEALPALCVADPAMFPEIVSAFEAKGLKVHDPSRTRLVTSSLGHLVAQLSALKRTRSYQVFSSFVRGGDVRRYLMEELKLDDEKLTAALVDLDNRQAEFLPETIDDIASKTSGTLRAIFEHVNVQLRKRGVRGMLFAIFRGKILDDADPAAREFAAAAECVNAIFDEVESAAGGNDELFALRLEEAAYSLEPDEGEVILTDGWLELPYLEADEVVIAGFQEGRVPEAVVGHPFLPDSLRRALGLTDNIARTERDRGILKTVLANASVVRIYFHAVDAKGDVLKPSRLLFEDCDDEELIRRVKSFYGVKAGTGATHAPEIPANWKLKLPIPPEHRELLKISPTRLDGYLRCPFTYYLREKDILGDKRMDDRAEELESWEYGNLAHDALEKFGGSELKDSEDADRIYAYLAERVDAQLAERFGTAIPAIVAMQGESVKRRLRNFSVIQAEHRREGWKIEAVERKLEVMYDHTRFHGKCDRVDRNEKTGEWCVIDYKTWDSADKAEAFKRKKTGELEWHSLQLPIYCAMLDADSAPEFAPAKLDVISSCYCVLGKTKDDVVFTPRMNGRGNVEEAEKKIRELIALIERGIFWPPGPGDEWQWDYRDWLGDDPAKSVDETWLADQLRRLASV